MTFARPLSAARGRRPSALSAVVGGLAAALALAACANGDDGRTAASNGANPRTAAFTRWIPLRPSPLERSEVAAARIGRHIYVAGGFLGPVGATTGAVARYDIRRNTWRRVADMPVGLNHPAAAAYKGDFYVVGGYGSTAGLTGETDVFLRFDPRTGRWSRMPPMPTKRAALTAGVISDRLYVAGGAKADGTAFKRLEIFDFKRRRWSRGPDMPTAREHLGSAVAGGAFYVLGGRTTSTGNLKANERFDPSTRRWQRLGDMRTARGGNTATAVGGRPVVVGGEDLGPGGLTIREVELYDPATRRWRNLPAMRTPRHGLAAVTFGRRIYALEGGDKPGGFYTNVLEVLDVR